MVDREKVVAGLMMLVDRKNDDTCEGLKCCKIAEDTLALLKENDKIKEQFIEAFNTIRDAYNIPANREKILLNYLMRNACCCEQKTTD